MKITPHKHFKFIAILILSFFILGGQPVKFGTEKTFFHGYLIEKPIIKIGLGVNLSDIKITASSGMKIYEVNARYKMIADDTDEVHIKGNKEKLTEKFLLQVFQTKDKDKAELFAEELKAKVDNKIYVTEDRENQIGGFYQVKVGDFLTRGDALSFIKKLNQIGIKESWILREEITEDKAKPHWILVNDELKKLHETTVLYFIPKSKQSYLSYNGRDYRGIFVLKASPKGLVLINILNIENYLKGVVPSELSPYDFRELEAHKAQAVAARTYAIKKLGMNDDLGFDLSDTPLMQFYSGMSAEHPLSTLAVAMTRGEVAEYKGKLIDALYTSTCGGMTEDVENVFGGPSFPYLRSTECVYEKQEECELTGRPRIPPILVEGININSIVARLISLKIIPDQTDLDFFRKEASFEEATNWITSALSWLGKQRKNFPTQPSPLNMAAFVRLVGDAFDWNERVENLLIDSEKEFILKDYEKWNGEDGDNLAYMIQSGIFSSSQKVRKPDAVLTRGDLAYYLSKIIKSYRDLADSGTLINWGQNHVQVEEGVEVKDLSLSPDVFLLKNNDGECGFAQRISIMRGDTVRWIANDGEIKLLEVVYPPYSNILDRSSSLHRWQVRKSREKLEKRVNEFYPIGELRDLIIQKRGQSKRVIELLIKGSEAQALIKGFKIRRVLGLKDTLFVVDREYDDTGRITHFVFRGRGWGHGVGLCQVGAFGMARAGADYKEILKKYYRGIKIEKIY
jgi:stage II sporulation protein D